MSGFAASKAQRQRVRFAMCIACGQPHPDPAHLIPRSLCSVGQDEPLAVIPLCRRDHQAYDQGRLDLLPFLEPGYRKELAFAVERFGLLPTVRRVTNQRMAP